MKIKTDLKLKCSRCGGVKYIDEPYLISSEWNVDVTCLTCGHSKTVDVKTLNSLLKKLNEAVKK